MSAIRRSSRITKKSCISVNLNVSNGVEFVDSNGFVENMDEESKWTAEIVDDEDDGDEELIENPDGTMSIKMANKTKDTSRLECDKCGLSFATNEVNIGNFCCCVGFRVLKIPNYCRRLIDMRIYAVICHSMKLPIKTKKIMQMSMFITKNMIEFVFVAMKILPQPM